MPLDAHANASRGIIKFVKANLTKHHEVFLKCSRRKKRRTKFSAFHSLFQFFPETTFIVKDVNHSFCRHFCLDLIRTAG